MHRTLVQEALGVVLVRCELVTRRLYILEEGFSGLRTP